MKYIIKKHPPKVLQEYIKTTPNASWEGCPCKREWKKSLLEEQGYICAYTMKKIDETDMKIEHFLPRNGKNARPDLALEYRNTLGVCNGKGVSEKDEYADTRKKDKLLTFIDPRSKDCERKIKYSRKGLVEVDDPILRKELIDGTNSEKYLSILNLNYQPLITGRLRAYRGMVRAMGKPEKEWRKIDVEDMIKKYSKRDKEGKHQEYCMFVIYRLKMRLKRFN